MCLSKGEATRTIMSKRNLSKHILGILIAVVLMALFLPGTQAQAQGYCYHALPQRLQVGGQGRVTPGLPNILRSQPYRGYDSIVLGQIPAGGLFTVMGGPSCYDGMYWWQVNYGGSIGWTPEGSNSGIYWTEPATFSDGCMTAISRLTAGQYGRVLPGDPNVLRSQPWRGTGSAILATMPAGATFQVLNGVSCSEGMSWWQVAYSGVIGWTPEGQGYTYWLEPLAPVGTPIPNICHPTQNPHMFVGYTGIVSPGLPNNLRAQPSLGASLLASMSSGGTFIVLAGPTCAEGLAWWQVNYGGIVGWTVEGQNSQFWIDPLVCPGFQLSRLAANRYARVTPGLPNRLRASASTYAATLMLIPAGGRFIVIGGPVCSESAAWWQVSYGGIIGWTMEGQGNQYWLELSS